MIQKYKTKPVIKEAVELRPDTVAFLKEWAGLIHGITQEGDTFGIPTMEGLMQVYYGYFIINGIRGEFYGCSPDVFHKTYESTTGEENEI